MIIKVEQEDIDKGVKRDVEACAIARALRRKTHKKVSVGTFLARVYQNRKVTRYHLPDEAVSFISRFDAGQPVQPITFEMKPY